MRQLYKSECLTLCLMILGCITSACSRAAATAQIVWAGSSATASAIPSATPTPNATQVLGPTLDAEKQAFFESLYGDQEPPSAEEAQTPYLTRHERISPTPFIPEPTSTVAIGITRDCWETYPHILVPINCAVEQVGNEYHIAYAGARKNMLQQGLLIVYTRSLDRKSGTPSAFYYTPEQKGWIEIERVDGAIVHLLAQDGSHLAFDTTTRAWLTPTVTPAP